MKLVLAAIFQCVVLIAPNVGVAQSEAAPNAGPGRSEIQSNGINARIFYPDTIPLGVPVAGYARIWNSNSIQRIFDSVVLQLNGALGSTLFAISGVSIGAEDSLDLTFIAITSYRGTNTLELVVHDDWRTANDYFVAVPAAPHWKVRGGRVNYCDRNIPHEFWIENPFLSDAVIDSIVSLTDGWSVTPRDIASLPINARARVTVQRNTSAGNRGLFVVNPRGAAPDTMVVYYDLPGYIPQVIPEADTTYIEVEVNESKTFVISAKNKGSSFYKLRPALHSTSDAWSMQPIDTNQVILISAYAQIFLEFAGQSVVGDYPFTVTLQTNGCDDPMTRTVIARVGTASSVDHDHNSRVNVYPLPASNLLNVETPLSTRITLLDILGREVHSVVATEANTKIDVSSFAPGSYVLVLESDGRTQSKQIMIERR